MNEHIYTARAQHLVESFFRREKKSEVYNNKGEGGQHLEWDVHRYGAGDFHNSAQLNYF